MSVGKTIARGLIGGLFVGHGTQKLKGWFGGPGLDGTDGMMQSLNMYPVRRNSLAAGITETAGGTMLALGLATPLASAALIGTMITAIRKVHLPNGPWAANGGWEFNAVLIAALIGLAEDGPGDVSVDRMLGFDRSGAAWGLGALAMGAAVSTAAIESGRRSAPVAAVQDDSSAPDTAGDPMTDDDLN
jgi:putative oxidoreductase